MRSRLRTAGALLSIITSLLLSACFALLGVTFGYPEIIREDTAVILTRLYEQRAIVPYLYYGLAVSACLLVFCSVLLRRIVDCEGERNLLAELGQLSGIIAGVLFCTGILRYFTLFPYLAQTLQGGRVSYEVIDVVFNSFQLYTGNTITEHVMFAFLSLMGLFFSAAFIQTDLVKRWVSILGILASVCLFYGNLELFALPFAFVFNRFASEMLGVWLLVVGANILLSDFFAKRSATAKGVH